MNYRIHFFMNPEAGASCQSFIENGRHNAALRHAKERMQIEHFLKAEIWQEADGQAKKLYTLEAKNIEYVDMLLTNDMDEVRAGFRKPRQYEVMYPATDSELLQAMQRYGGFGSMEYDRMGHNVAIADGAILVALKPQPANVNTLYVIDGQQLPLQGYDYDHISGKVWATPAVLADIRKAEATLLAQRKE